MRALSAGRIPPPFGWGRFKPSGRPADEMRIGAGHSTNVPKQNEK
jgi:hypothetical protein